MDGTHRHLALTAFWTFLVPILLQASVQAQTKGCTARDVVEIPENNEPGYLVETIVLQPGASVTLLQDGSENPFTLDGTKLRAAFSFDAERNSSFVARPVCSYPPNPDETLIIIVLVKNLNDNPPVFGQKVYNFNINELSPENTQVGRVDAQDLDNLPLYYRLDGETSGFKLLSSTVPQILVQTPPNYDTVKKVSLTLFVQDTSLTSPGTIPSYNDSTTVEITILDVDNRPPWFQPCTKYENGANVICSSSGYTGQVTLNKKEPGFLKLNPGPLYAIDGDAGINAEITYSILGGNDGALFRMDPNTGNISMQRETDTLETITLTVLAAQKTNSFQFSTTSVTIKVLTESFNPPVFQSPRYQGTVTGLGNAALDEKGEPVQFIATDADYAATGGINPNIIYYVNERNEFSIVGGFLFVIKNLPEATLNLQVVAKDTSNEETATAELLLEVKPGPTTVPPTTTENVSPTSPSTATGGTPSGTTIDPSGTAATLPTGRPVTTIDPSGTTATLPTTRPVTTIDPSGTTATLPTTRPVTTIDPSGTTSILPPTQPVTTKPSVTTTKPSTEDSGATTGPAVTTATTAHLPTVKAPVGGFGPSDMAALGATLGFLLCVCLVAIGFLVARVRRERSDWKKIYESNRFRNALNRGEKEDNQYSNKALVNDEDGSSNGSGSPKGGTITFPEKPTTPVEDIKYLTTEEPSKPVLEDSASQSGSDGDDKEKEVKPILTKGRRQDEGYKSVWFKEDIDPEAKEEVVIIPDSRESDSDEDEEEEEEQTGSTRGEDNSETKRPKARVGFKDGVDRKEDDSGDDEVLTVDL